MRMLKAVIVACVLACVVASAPAKAKALDDVVFSFDSGAYITDLVAYSDTPCEDYWVSGSATVNWNGHDGECVITEATYAAAKAGDTRFTAKQRAAILTLTRLASGGFGSPVAILD